MHALQPKKKKKNKSYCIFVVTLASFSFCSSVLSELKWVVSRSEMNYVLTGTKIAPATTYYCVHVPCPYKGQLEGSYMYIFFSGPLTEFESAICFISTVSVYIAIFG